MSRHLSRWAYVLSVLGRFALCLVDTYNDKPGWIELVSWHPRAFLYHNFLSDGEADHIVKRATPLLRRSTVVGGTKDNRTEGQDEIRTSYGCFLSKNSDTIISEIEHRIAVWTHLPVENQEDLQVLRYYPGQKYGAHWDEKDPLNEDEDAVGGEGASIRIATVLLYLADSQSGGETAFPHGLWLNDEQRKLFQSQKPAYSECGLEGVGIRARKGDALLFWGMKPGAQRMDYRSMHTGCPPTHGALKLTATKWIHAGKFH